MLQGPWPCTSFASCSLIMHDCNLLYFARFCACIVNTPKIANKNTHARFLVRLIVFLWLHYSFHCALYCATLLLVPSPFFRRCFFALIPRRFVSTFSRACVTLSFPRFFVSQSSAFPNISGAISRLFIEGEWRLDSVQQKNRERKKLLKKNHARGAISTSKKKSYSQPKDAKTFS